MEKMYCGDVLGACYQKVPNTRPHYNQVLKCKASNQILVLQVLCYKELHCSRAQVYTILTGLYKSICTEILHLITCCNYFTKIHTLFK